MPETVAVNIAHREAETAAMHRNNFTIGIDHDCAESIKTAPPDRFFRLPVICGQVISGAQVRTQPDFEGIPRGANFREFFGKKVQIDMFRIDGKDV